MSRSVPNLALTLAVASAGGAVAAILGLPVAWLLGSAFAVAAASLAGLDTALPNRLRNVVFFILGVQAGSGVTPEVVGQLDLWPLSFAIQMLGVAGVIAITYAFLHRILKWDAETALFAALPGALSFVLAAASETRADMMRVIVVQSMRLLFLIGVLTPTLAWLQGGDAGGVVLRGEIGSPLEYLMLLGVCLVLAFLGARLKVPGGMLLGALIGSAIMHGSDLAPVAIPVVIFVPAMIVLGAVIGGRLRAEDRAVIPSLLPAAIGSFAIGIAATMAAGALAYAVMAIDIGKIVLAYSPGALEAMTVLAFQFDLDPAYVAAHHVVRFFAIALIVPLLAGMFAKRDRQSEEAVPSGVDGREDRR